MNLAWKKEHHPPLPKPLRTNLKYPILAELLTLLSVDVCVQPPFMMLSSRQTEIPTISPEILWFLRILWIFKTSGMNHFQISLVFFLNMRNFRAFFEYVFFKFDYLSLILHSIKKSISMMQINFKNEKHFSPFWIIFSF